MFRGLLAGLVVLVASNNVLRAENWASKMFKTSSHDFGVVARGAKAEYEFEITNPYVEDVHISSVSSSCGCTHPEIVTDTIKTYETGTIRAKFNTDAFMGQRSATVTVRFDKPYYAEVQIKISGYIRTDVIVRPGVVDFGTLDMGTGGEKTVRVEYAGRSDWQIREVKSPNPNLTAAVKEVSRFGGTVLYDLVVKLDPTSPAGYMNEPLTLVTNDSRATEFPVSVQGRVVSELTVRPGTLFLGAITPGKNSTKQVVITGKKPFKITDIHCDQGCFAFKLPTESKMVHVIPVTFTAADNLGKVTTTVTIQTDLGENLTAEFNVYGQVIKPVDTSATAHQ